MTSFDPSSATWFEDSIEAFENAWRSGSRPVIAEFLLARDESFDPLRRPELLWELIRVDLEYRWRQGKERGRKPGSRGPLLSWYVKRLNELESLDALPLSLIAEEYRVRRRWGDAPSHAEYVARFPGRGPALSETLANIDVALADEGLNLAQAPVPKSARDARRTDPDAPLPYQDYHLKRQIGEGGMCRVYTAVQVSLDKPVAVKVLRKEWLGDTRSIQRFLREARLTASLAHSGIVGVHGLGRLPDGGYFMVLDLFPGHDLSRCGALPADRATRIVARLAEILAYVHGAGVLHCDVKPSNVLVDEQDNVCLTDFGLARRFGSGAAETVFDEHPAGTAAYMAPEQIDGRFGELGPWTDVYGLGGVLYSLLTGAPRFAGEAVSNILSQVVSDAPPAILPELEPNYESLGHICRRCLRQMPADRYHSALQVRQELLT